jgi:surface polysaccharide O-acyltransferase-like enzyme
MQEKKFLHYIHYFRGTAILFIVGLHACISLKWGGAIMQRKVALVLFNNGTVLFVFISGYLFYHLNKNKFDYLDYLKKKFLYVIVPYLIVSVPAIIDKFYFDKMGDHWWMDHGFGEKSILSKIFVLLITGRHMGVLWFIPMISIFYLLAPLLLKFAKSKIFSYVAPIIIIAGLFTFRFGYYANIGLSLLYFFPVYIFGIWTYQLKDKLFEYSKSVIIVLGAMYMAMNIGEVMEWIAFDDLIRIRDGYVIYNGERFNYNKFKMQILCVLLLLLFYRLNHKQFNLLKLLGDYSFGIFFVHLYVIEILRVAEQHRLIKVSPPNFFTFLLYYAFIMLVTVVIVKLIKLVFKEKSRHLIGS